MKRIFKFSFVLMLLCVLGNVYAGEAKLDSMKIEANILENGDMKVTEKLIFEVTGKLNGLYRDINLSSNSKYGASDIDIEKVMLDSKEMTMSEAQLSNGVVGQYNINVIDDGKQIKVYNPLNQGSCELEITYVLKDVVALYQDVAELHWNFVGKEWENRIDDINIEVIAPGNSENFRVWAHGPLDGVINKIGNSKADIMVGNVPANVEVTARMVMDKDLFTNVKKTYESLELDNILAEEQKYADEANLKRDLSKKMVYYLCVGGILFVICPIIWYVIKKKEFENSDFDGKYYRELPEDYGPSVAASILEAGMIDNSMLATIMDLARRGYIKITEEKNAKGKTKDYLFELQNKEKLNEDKSICASAKYLVQSMLFDESDSFTTKEFKKRFDNTSKQSAAVLKKQKWVKKVEEDAQKFGLYKDKVPSTIKGCWVFALLPVIYNIVITGCGFYFDFDDVAGLGILLSIFSVTVQIITAGTLYKSLRYSKKGVTHREQWKAFSRFLNDFSKMEDYPVQSLIIWEHFLVYAVMLNKAKTVIKQLEIVYPDEFTDTSQNLLSNYALMRMCRDSATFSDFNKTFNSAISTAFTPQSSGSGAGGGFSGGGGSGGGGGGGGGF